MLRGEEARIDVQEMIAVGRNRRDPYNLILKAQGGRGALFIGGRESAMDEKLLRKLSIELHVNAAKEMIKKLSADVFHVDLQYRGGSEKDPLCQSAIFIAAAEAMEETLAAGGNVFVNCARGRSRSASLVLFHLFYSKQVSSLREAYVVVKTARPIIGPHKALKRQLFHLERRFLGATSVPERGNWALTNSMNHEET